MRSLTKGARYISFMRHYTASASRSRTPPLVYRRSESALPPLSSALHGSPLSGELESTPQYPTSIQFSSVNPSTVPSCLSTATSSYGTVNYVSNPFRTSASRPSLSFENGYSRSSVVGTSEKLESSLSGTASYQGYGDRPTALFKPRFTVEEESSRLLSQDAEDVALQGEEAALKAKLSELRTEHQMLDDEQLHLGKGWSSLFEREQRYYTEPAPDFSLETIRCEQRCLALQEQVNHANAHLERLRSELTQYEYVLEDKKRVCKEIQSLRATFMEFEKRRQNCLSTAGQFFDVESKRVTEAQRAVLDIDEQLLHKPDNASTVLTSRVSEETNTSKCLKETPTDYLEDNRKSKGSWSCSAADQNDLEEEEEQDATSSTMDLSSSIPGCESADHRPHTFCPDVLQESICIPVNDDELNNDNFARMIGGPSTVISLNNQPDYIFPCRKRKKVDFCIT